MNSATKFAAAASALALCGAVAAPASTASANDPFPESEGWTYVDSTVVIPGGYACDGPIKIRTRGHERTLINGTPAQDLPEDAQPKPGDRAVHESPDEHFRIINKRTGQNTGWLSDSGTIVDVVRWNNRDLRSVGYGRNFYLGAGIYGILYAGGQQRFTVKNFMGGADEQRVVMHEIHGWHTELCRRVGLHPVPGQNYDPEANHHGDDDGHGHRDHPGRPDA